MKWGPSVIVRPSLFGNLIGGMLLRWGSLPILSGGGWSGKVPWDRSKYPPDWEELAKRLKDEAGWCCRHCGHPHDPASGHTLTVHHLDLDPTNCEESNLLACCQKCHLSLQAKYRPGQAPLPGLDAPAWLEERRDNRG